MRTRRFGGPKASLSVRVNLRLDESEQVAIDRWRDEHAKGLTRAEAIRHLVRLGLGTADVQLGWPASSSTASKIPLPHQNNAPLERSGFSRGQRNFVCPAQTSEKVADDQFCAGQGSIDDVTSLRSSKHRDSDT
jgi:hypothetical protein